MMNKLEEAIIYATILHQGNVRKFTSRPCILHPLEVAQILSTMTEDQDVITAGILHDIVEETDGTLEEIEKRFGKRVADLVSSDTENGQGIHLEAAQGRSASHPEKQRRYRNPDAVAGGYACEYPFHSRDLF